MSYSYGPCSLPPLFTSSVCVKRNAFCFCCLNLIEFPIAFWGAIRAGIVVVPLNTLLLPEQYGFILNNSRAAAIVIAGSVVAARLGHVLEHSPNLRTVVLVGRTSAVRHSNVHRFEDLLRGSYASPFTASTFGDEVACWLYTSGSTGNPKAAKHLHLSFAATARLFGQNVLQIKRDDVVFSAAKLFFAYGLGNAMSFPMSVGACSVLLDGRPTPETVLAIMGQHNPTVFYGVPSLYAAMLAHPSLSKGAGSARLRICVSAGEALPAPLGQRWKARVGVDILDGIGSTEMLQTFISNHPTDVRYGSTGKAVSGYDARVVDEHGRDLPDGEIGELVVRGPSAAEGYWNNRSLTHRTFVGEWTYTGDKFVRDRQGYFYHCGRTDDMIKVSGMWVSPFEVEFSFAVTSGGGRRGSNRQAGHRWVDQTQSLRRARCKS